MPIEITNLSDDEQSVSVGSYLEEDGEPTLQAVVLKDFLDDVDFTHFFEDAEVRELVEVSDSYARFDKELDAWVECNKGDDDATLVVIETLTGEDLAGIVDEADLRVMFDYYLENEHPRETLEDKMRLAVFGCVTVDESDLEGLEGKALEEAKGPFKKGDFQLIAQNPAGHKLVNRMLGAMIHKEAIQRATAPGDGYRGGDYDKDVGYASGTAKGVKKWKKHLVSKSAEVAKAAKATKKKVKIRGKTIGGAKKAVKKAGKKAGSIKKVAAKKAKKKGALSAHDNTATANLNESNERGLVGRQALDPTNVSESTSLTKRVMAGMSVKSD